MKRIDGLERRSAAAIGRAIAGGLDPVEVADLFLERIALAADAAVFLCVSAERARAEAEASRRRHAASRPLGPLDGVPVSWKDLIDVAGTPTTAGSSLLRGGPPVRSDAPVVANAAAAGMVTLGKVNLTEFAYSGLGLNPHFGTPANPFDPTTPRVPGGSSSGSAVGVARGLAPVSVGSDTGGSVRIPAAFNGLVGYKSSEGRIPKRGVIALSPTLDTVGPMARSVEDCLLMDAVLRGVTPPSLPLLDPHALRLVVAPNVVNEGIEDAVGANFEDALARLSRAGVTIVRRDLPMFDDMVRVTAKHGSLTAAEAYWVHRERVESGDVAHIDRRVVARILGGKRMSAHDLVAIQQERIALGRALLAALDGAMLAMPTVPHVAPEIAPLEADDELYHRVNLKTLRNTMLGNFFNTPGLALPSGADAHGLPTSILVSAAAGEDERLLAAGLVVERCLAA
jgi:aspartyl-tRNA(Asn)/glutamyl-tRNA(Gln) amidotransferase subunit A